MASDGVPADVGPLPWLPATAFVLVWCSGYIAGPVGVDAVAPFTILAWRFGLAAVVAALLCLATRRRWRMSRQTLMRVAVVGLAMNAVQFGLMYVAFELGLSATLGSLYHALSPVLTVVLAAMLLGERIGRWQVVGFITGVAGVLVVLAPDVESAGGLGAVALGALSMLGLSLGTLGQRWIGAAPDPLWSATVQFAVSAPPLFVLGWLVEGAWPVEDGHQAWVALAWLAVINSIVGLVLLGALVRAGGAGAAGSLFFLAPPVTAVMAWVVLGETLGPRELVGLVVAVVGVGVATRRRAAPAAPRVPES